MDKMILSLSEEVHELVSLTKQLKISELRIEHEGTKVYIRRSPGDVNEVFVPDAEIPVETATAPPIIITAPMVGRFYRSAGSDEEPLINIGQTIEQGQKVCVIESMMILNEVLSEFDGVVVNILAEDGQGVEYGQPLFEIVKSSVLMD